MTGLRAAALVAVASGQVASAVAGVLSVPLLVVALAVTAAGAAVSAQGRAAEAVRRGATLAVGLLALAVLPRVTAGEGLREVLGPLLVGVVAVQAWTWQARSDLRTGVVAACGLLVLGASYAPDVLVGLPLLVGWGAALAALVLAVRERATEGADVVLEAPSPRAPLVLAAAFAALLGLVAFLLVPVPEEAGLQSRLARAAAAAGLSGGRAAPGAYTGDVVDLRVRGELSEEELVQVPADSPALWRSGVYTDWDGASWSRPAVGRRVDGPPFDIADDAGETRTDDVRVRRRASGTVWAPGPVQEVSLLGSAVGVDALGAVRGPTWPGYTVRSLVVRPSDEELRTGAGPDQTDPRWTTVPARVPDRVRALGQQLASGAPTRLDAVRAVERWLAENATYRLDSPVPAPGEDAVDRFLFVDRIGFCEQFAAAEVLLLRAAGIPARFVTGLAYGVDAGDGWRTYRQKDLHAWVEVFHPGTGWVSSDPTPPATQLAGAPLRVRVAARLTALLQSADDVPGGRPTLASGLLALAAAVATALLVRRRRRPVLAAGLRPLPVRAEGRPALQAFLRWDARLGDRRRGPAESLRELQDRLDLPPDVRKAIEVVEQECYAATPPPGATDATAVLDRVQA